MKKIFLFFIVGLLVGCSGYKTNSEIGRKTVGLPVGAEIIAVYETQPASRLFWVKWKFENECFLSCGLNIHSYSAVLTKINCPE